MTTNRNLLSVSILVFLSVTIFTEEAWTCTAPVKKIAWKADNISWSGEYGCIHDYDDPRNCEWSLEREDIQEFSIKQQDFRIETWLQSHLSGSGSGRLVVIYQCDEDVLHEVFRKNIEGMKEMPRIENGRIHLKQLTARKNDPMCCPSKESEKILIWKPGKATFSE